MKAWRLTWANRLDEPEAYRFAQRDMFWRDHGFVRAIWKNRFEIAPGVWRSNQPAPADIAEFAKMGVKTIINLRGVNHWGSYLLEERTAAEFGITLINDGLYSSRAPQPDDILRVVQLMKTSAKPLVVHCKSGADRAGLASAIYLLATGTPATEAAKQLSIRHAHLSISRTGILDAFVASFAKAEAETGIAFLEWVTSVYDPETLMRDFQQNRKSSRILDWVLRRE